MLPPASAGLELLANGIRQENEVGGVNRGNEELKLLFDCLENPRVRDFQQNGGLH